MSQINCLELYKASNVEVDGAWASLAPLLLANKKFGALGITEQVTEFFCY